MGRCRRRCRRRNKSVPGAEPEASSSPVAAPPKQKAFWQFMCELVPSLCGEEKKPKSSWLDVFLKSKSKANATSAPASGVGGAADTSSGQCTNRMGAICRRWREHCDKSVVRKLCEQECKECTPPTASSSASTTTPCTDLMPDKCRVWGRASCAKPVVRKLCNKSCNSCGDSL